MDPVEKKTNVISLANYRSSSRLAALLIALQVLIFLISYPFLPEIVPSHWNLTGQVDSYAPKWLNAPLIPLASLLTYVLLRRLMTMGPRLIKDSQRSTFAVVDRISIALVVMLLALQLLITAASLHLPVDMSFFMPLLVGGLFVFIGNYLGKVRRNFWAGIRTPWTLVSDTVWERTHRFASGLFVLAGLLMLLSSFFPPIRLWGVLIPLAMVVVLPVGYSYLVYRRLETGRGEVLSSPFDAES